LNLPVSVCNAVITDLILLILSQYIFHLITEQSGSSIFFFFFKQKIYVLLFYTVVFNDVYDQLVCIFVNCICHRLWGTIPQPLICVKPHCAVLWSDPCGVFDVLQWSTNTKLLESRQNCHIEYMSNVQTYAVMQLIII